MLLKSSVACASQKANIIGYATLFKSSEKHFLNNLAASVSISGISSQKEGNCPAKEKYMFKVNKTRKIEKL